MASDMNADDAKLDWAWRTVIVLLIVGWVPGCLDDLVHKIPGLQNSSDADVALGIGFITFVWLPCNLIVSAIMLYKLFMVARDIRDRKY